MKEYSKELLKEQERLIKEISGMKKFSFKKLLKVIELDALISYSAN
ncbi:MAG: hypothetical protein IKL47_00210 [Clostridia bacterium]|nr:hypothetical protein [Clostridia bacterium]